jgi:flagellar P-ring protein precursor FlgI
MKTCRLTMVLATLTAVALLAVAGPAEARTRMKDICRIKGQEENTLQGLGIVVGLRGTGDGGGFLPTIRSLAMAMQLMGNPIGAGGQAELKDARNVALVMVTATVPAAGARQGDQLDCMVSSIGASKSLLGGRLFMTPLQGPQVESTKVYGFCQGAIHLDDATLPTTGRIHGGCRLEEDFFNVFSKDNKITLVIEKNHADFEVAQEIAEVINSQLSIQTGDEYLAKAINALNVEVKIPKQYREDPVQFVTQVMGLTMPDPQTDARVVINQRAGSVVIGSDVEIGSVVVTHKNIVIQTGDDLPAPDRFVPLDPEGTQTTKLKSLVESLNAIKVPTEDIIEIIKGLDRNGKLYGRLIVE